MLVLTNAVQPYAWGARDGLVRWVGTPPSGGPEAELWVGAHPAAPSALDDGRTLDRVVAADPTTLLGAEVVDRFGPRLPFLLKVLAIGAPLSIQLHPTAEQAREGFAREEASGRDRDDPTRSYRDPFAKPEVLVALEPTWVLTGLRSGAAAAAALRGLGVPTLEPLAARVEGAPDSRAALVHLLTAAADERAALAEAASAVGGGARGTPSDAPDVPVDDRRDAATWVGLLADAHPGDPTALAPALLGLRRLGAGDAVFLPAGVPHAYLRGAGVELMGASDNVVRGGLTPKHVDPDELVALLAPPGTDVTLLPGTDVEPGLRSYDPPTPELGLHRIAPGTGELAAPNGPGPAVALAVGGDAEVRCGDDRIRLGGGRGALVPASEREGCRVTGPGTVWWATVGAGAGSP